MFSAVKIIHVNGRSFHGLAYIFETLAIIFLAQSQRIAEIHSAILLNSVLNFCK